MEDKFGNKIEDSIDSKLKEEEKNFKEVKKTVNSFFGTLLDIRKDTDKRGTIEDIKNNISMQGHTAWILVFSILIASIGLNANSTAVVIGAMLISPLMGPILGVGLSIGINDIDTLKRSLKNLAVMVGLSLLTSFLFFSIPSFKEFTSEIQARTAPDVRDVFIAIAGGLALIIALSRRSEQTNTVAGVAIATALMPPLCTAGYGLAVGSLKYFAGAMFLFTINTIFIALSTFIIVKFLRFPMVKYINSAKRKRIARLASFVAIIILGFSIWSFSDLILKNQFQKNAKNFITDLKNNGVNFINENKENIDYEDSEIKLYVFGKRYSKGEIALWQNKLPAFGLDGTKLLVNQGKDDSDLRKQVEDLTGLYSQNQKMITSKDESIREKEDKIKILEDELSKFYNAKINLSQISKEAKINFEGLESLGYSNLIESNFQTIDTITVFNATWQEKIPKKKRDNAKLKLWLQTRLKLDTIQFSSH